MKGEALAKAAEPVIPAVNSTPAQGSPLVNGQRQDRQS